MLSISVSNETQLQQLDHRAGPFEFGRGPAGAVPRLVIDDAFVSRDHLRVEELPGQRLRVSNLSTKNPATLGDGTSIPPNGSRELPLPVCLKVGATSIALGHKPEATLDASREVTTKPLPAAAAPAASRTTATRLVTGATAIQPMPQDPFAAGGYLSIQPVRGQGDSQVITLNDTPSPEKLTHWMETVLALQRSAAGNAEIYAEATGSMIKLIGLDVGLVLLHGDRGWQVVARSAREEDDSRPPRPSGREYSQTVLRQVLAEKQTFYQDLALMQSQESLQAVDAVVVSPIFGVQDEVIGALYGMRQGRGRGKAVRIRPLEAQLVQLLAAAVGANLARTVATRTRTQFEQFFSPELARELARDPALLEGRDQDVTILMSDLRGFSALSERLGPGDTCRLIRDVMERLSERIVEHGGVIVSYLGDGLLAMWNAPARQENHAVLACRAALAMLAELPVLNAAWEPVVGRPLTLGIGVNTGTAQVGNTGSSRKFMYGPLGNTVNLASRIEGATKHFKVPVLITGTTRAQLGDAFATRRLGKVRVVGIGQPVELYELYAEAAAAEWLAFRDTYEKALALYETRQWLQTCQLLLPLMEQAGQTGRYDHATFQLITRSWTCLENPADSFDPVMALSSK